jgi:hypothetical protein
VVVKDKGTRGSDGLRMVERAGIGVLSSTDSWLLYSEFETIILVQKDGDGERGGDESGTGARRLHPIDWRRRQSIICRVI